MDPRKLHLFVLALLVVFASAFLAGCTAITADALATRPAAGELTVLPIDTPAPTAIPNYVDLTDGGQVTFGPTDTLPSPTFMPHLMRDFRPQASVLGVALEGFMDEAAFPQALALSIHFGRRWRDIAWRDIEPVQGEYHWEALGQLETELRNARAANVTPILNVQMTPDWAQGVRPYACGPIRRDKFDAFADFMVQLVERYGSGSEYNVRYWQIANEPDIAVGIVGPDSVFGCWGDLNDPYYGGKYFGEMLQVVYPRIKAADPNAVVIMGGLLLECDPYTMTVPDTCRNEERLKSGYFLEGVLIGKGAENVDMIDVHNYGLLDMNLPARMTDYYNWSGPQGGTGIPEKVAFVRRLLEKYGRPDLPIMISEVALKCETPSDDCQDVGSAYIPRAYAEGYGLGLHGMIYYALITEFMYKGLLLEDHTPKKQYYAYQYLGSQLSWVEHVGPVTQFSGVEGQEFKQSFIRRLWILWSADGTDQTITLPDDFVQAFDKYGNVVPVADQKLVVGWSPVYVQLAYTSQ